MYLRPRMIYERFLIMECKTRLDEMGRSRVEYEECGELWGAVSRSDPAEKEKWRGLKHETTHKIVQRLSEKRALTGDLLVNGERKFVVKSVENPCGLGQYFIYYVTEREDL